MIYVQGPWTLLPLGGSLWDVAKCIEPKAGYTLVDSSLDVYMNPHTGSVAFEDDWESLQDLVRVEFDFEFGQWVEA